MADEVAQRAAAWITAAGQPADDLEQKVENGLRSRIESGEFAEKDVVYINNLKLRMVEGSLDVSTTELEQLRRLCQLWDINIKSSGFTSHRPLIGPLIVSLKKVLFPIVKLFMRDTLRQQREFNAQLIALLTDMLNRSGKDAHVQGAANSLPREL